MTGDGTTPRLTARPSARPGADPGAGAGRALVLVLHGGQENGRSKARALDPPVLRMAPVAAAIRRAVPGKQATVRRPQFALRGWNGADASPARELTRWLDELAQQPGPPRVVLIGHSMGARAAVRAAGHPLVVAVGALAPWLPGGEPAGQAAGRRILLAHGTVDRMTSPPATWKWAERAAAEPGAAIGAVELEGVGHAMLRRPRLWHALAAEFTLAALDLPPRRRRLRELLDQAGPVPTRI